MWKTLNLLKFNSNDHWNVLTCPVFDEFKFSNWTQISCWTLNNYFFSFWNCNTPSFSCLAAADTAFVCLGRFCSTSNPRIQGREANSIFEGMFTNFSSFSLPCETNMEICLIWVLIMIKICKKEESKPLRKIASCSGYHWQWSGQQCFPWHHLWTGLIMQQASKYEARVI